jgi:hypothetical protein
MTIADAIYLLCAATSLAAAILLLRQYAARRSAILLWSCIGFLGLAVNNVFVYLDFALMPQSDLSLPRSLAGAAAMMALVYGLVRETSS